MGQRSIAVKMTASLLVGILLSLLNSALPND